MALLVGYPAESSEGIGQNPVPSVEDTAFEGDLDTPFQRDEGVLDRLRQEGMLQPEAPMPWREDEVRYLSRMLGLAQEQPPEGDTDTTRSS